MTHQDQSKIDELVKGKYREKGMPINMRELIRIAKELQNLEKENNQQHPAELAHDV